MCDTSLNLPMFLSMNSKRPTKLRFSLLFSVLDFFKVRKKLANSSVWSFMGTKTMVSRFSTTRNLTCRVFPCSMKKIVVMDCSPCRESGVHLQRMSALKCFLLWWVRFRVSFIGFNQIISEVWIVQMVQYMLTILVGGGFLKRLSMNVKFVQSGGQEKVTFSKFRVFCINFVT